MSETLAFVMAPVYLIVGLSVLIYAKQWLKIMDKWKKDHFVMFPVMFMYAILGMIIIYMHNLWEWNVWLLITLTGWIMLVKSVGYFLLPGALIKAALEVRKNVGLIYLSGLVAIVIGAVLGYYAFFV